MTATNLRIVALISACLIGASIRAQTEAPPKRGELSKLVKRYLAADDDERSRIRAECDARYAPLPSGSKLKKLRKDVLKAASRVGRKISFGGQNYFYDEKEKKGRYISRRGKKTLFIGLHGGGAGSGSANSSASSMGGGGWSWIFPEVLEKTEHGWTTSGTEEFVIDLILAAKRAGKIDPDRVYITGHSMGGYGTWTLGAHHADLFAGAAAYAGASTPIFEGGDSKKVIGIFPGVIPNFHNLPLFVFQSLDDPRVHPRSNIFAAKMMRQWQADHPGGYPFRYEEVNGRGHAAPKEGYMPSQKWIASKRRQARPEKIVWQPSLSWKKHFYWLYWAKPELDEIIEAKVTRKNRIELDTLTGAANPKGLSVLLGEPHVDLQRPVTIVVGGKVEFEGKVERSFSTLLLTLPRHDAKLLFDARVDL